MVEIFRSLPSLLVLMSAKQLGLARVLGNHVKRAEIVALVKRHLPFFDPSRDMSSNLRSASPKKRPLEDNVAEVLADKITAPDGQITEEVKPKKIRIKLHKFAVLLSYCGAGYFGLQR